MYFLLENVFQTIIGCLWLYSINIYSCLQKFQPHPPPEKISLCPCIQHCLRELIFLCTTFMHQLLLFEFATILQQSNSSYQPIDLWLRIWIWWYVLGGFKIFANSCIYMPWLEGLSDISMRHHNVSKFHIFKVNAIFEPVLHIFFYIMLHSKSGQCH